MRNCTTGWNLMSTQSDRGSSFYHKCIVLAKGLIWLAALHFRAQRSEHFPIPKIVPLMDMPIPDSLGMWLDVRPCSVAASSIVAAGNRVHTLVVGSDEGEILCRLIRDTRRQGMISSIAFPVSPPIMDMSLSGTSVHIFHPSRTTPKIDFRRWISISCARVLRGVMLVRHLKLPRHTARSMLHLSICVTKRLVFRGTSVLR